MQLDEFLHNLHFDVDKVRPLDVEVDWDDAPLPFKLYQDLPVIRLPSEVSLSLNEIPLERKSTVALKEISNFFWYSYGLTQVCHTLLAYDEAQAHQDAMQMLRRYAPSGGALYPSELYAYLKIDGLTPGIYHYDPAHHSLVLLRPGNYDQYLERTLGHRCDLSSCFGALFVSTMYWKNFYKYHNFSYRLQALDAGALIGQLLEVAKRNGYASQVYFQFLDGAVNHLLGLRAQEETVYAVIPVSLNECPLFTNQGGTGGRRRIESADVVCREVAALCHNHYVKSKRITSYPLLTKLNEASAIHSTQTFTQLPARTGDVKPPDDSLIVLPKVESLHCDFAAVCRGRYSPGQDFSFGDTSLVSISTLLSEATSYRYSNDLVMHDEPADVRLDISGCVHGVDGLEDGAYLYDAKAHALRLLKKGDYRMPLQQGMSMPTVNLFQVPICLHLVGHQDVYQRTFGYRGYRIQQMEVGILLQRLLLSASKIGMAGHPLLGYDEGVCDEIYNFCSERKTCLIQVPVGHYRKVSRFEGPLYG